MIHRMESSSRAQRWFEEQALARIALAHEEREAGAIKRWNVEVALAMLGRSPERVLEIGCRGGSGLVHLAERAPGARLVGVELGTEMRAAAGARSRASVPSWDGTGEGLPLVEGGFSLVLSVGDLRLWRDPKDVLRGIAARLAPDGLAYVVDFHSDIAPVLKRRYASLAPDEATERYLADQLAAALGVREVERYVQAVEGLQTLTWQGDGTGAVFGVSIAELLADSPPAAVAFNALRAVASGSPVMLIHSAIWGPDFRWPRPFAASVGFETAKAMY
jgi:SAM-dependent methyltransferase